MARRQFNVFNLSFLDIMSCGLGAVVLFFMIISAQVSVRADKADIRLLSDTFRLEEEVLDGRKNLVRLRTVFEDKQQEKISAEGESKQLQVTLEELLEPKGVAVVIEAIHLCMMMRGVQQQNASATTSSIRGEFERDPKTRSEFMDLLQRRRESFA